MNTLQRILHGIPILFILLSTLLQLSSAHANDDGDEEQDESAHQHSVHAALRSAGVAALPTFLDAGTKSITLRLPKHLGGSTLTFGGTIDAEALAEKTFVFTTSDEHKLQWKRAFGLNFLHLDDVALHLKIDQEDIEMSLHGGMGGPFQHKGKDIEIEVEFAIHEKQLQDFTIALPHSKLKLSSIPDFRKIPGVHTFSIAQPVISMHAMGGKINFVKKNVDAMIFYDEEEHGWHVGFNFAKPLSIADLARHKKSFLKDIQLPKMRLVVSEKSLDMDFDDLPMAVQNFYGDADNLPDGNLNLPSGVNVLAVFDATTAPTDIRNKLHKIGLGNASLDVDGHIEGMFGKTPSVEIAIEMDVPSQHGFSFLKLKHAQAEFFMRLSKEEAELGFGTSVLMKQGKNRPDLEFDVDFAVQETETTLEALVEGEMKGDWVRAAGIKGLTIENPSLSVGINESGSFDVMIDGTAMVGKERVRAAADLVLSPEALGLPTAFAIAGEINDLKFSDLEAHAHKHAHQKNGGLKALNAEFKDVAFAFMTPEARLPADLEEELSIEGAGLALKATLLIDRKELGTAKGYASTDGLSLDGTLDPFKLGPISLKDAELSIQAGPDVDPHFMMSGDIELFKGFEEKYTIDLEPEHIQFSSETRFGGAFDATLNVETNGVHFKSGDDLKFEAELGANYDKVFRNMVQGALKALKKGDKDIAKAKSNVKKAQKSVNSLNDKIRSAKAAAKARVDKATSKMEKAKRKVDSLKHDIDINNHKAHDENEKAKKDAKHWKFASSAKHGVKAGEYKSAAGAEEVSLKAAEGILSTAEKAAKAVGVDSDPKVVSLEGELVTAKAALEAAQGVLSGAAGVNKGVEAAVKAVGKGLTALKVNRLGADGSLVGIISAGKEGTAPRLIIDVSLHGKRHVYYEDLDALEKGFEKIAQDIAKDVAKELLKIFKK